MSLFMKAVRCRFVPAVLFLTLAGLRRTLPQAFPLARWSFPQAGFSVNETAGTVVISVHRIQLDGDPFTVGYSLF
jgi:hypothetical protein